MSSAEVGRRARRVAGVRRWHARSRCAAAHRPSSGEGESLRTPAAARPTRAIRAPVAPLAPVERPLKSQRFLNALPERPAGVEAFTRLLEHNLRLEFGLTRALTGEICPSSFPSSLICPLVGWIRPAMHRPMVVFPEPLSPTSASVRRGGSGQRDPVYGVNGVTRRLEELRQIGDRQQWLFRACNRRGIVSKSRDGRAASRFDAAPTSPRAPPAPSEAGSGWLLARAGEERLDGSLLDCLPERRDESTVAVVRCLGEIPCREDAGRPVSVTSCRRGRGSWT